jgi:hypothetical protein
MMICDKLFGQNPNLNVSSPLEKFDQPNIESSELLEAYGHHMYQSMIGPNYLTDTIGRQDTSTAKMTISSFRIIHRTRYVEKLKRIYGYLSKKRHSALESDLNILTNLIY